MSRFKIHPAIGIARLGSSEQSYPGPTTVGVVPDPGNGGSYRDANKRLKSQSVRFFVFEYNEGDADLEPTPVDVGPGRRAVGIEWTVHLANKKAFWFAFEGLSGSKDIPNPPTFGYGPTPASWRNSHITNTSERRRRLVIDAGPRTLLQSGTSAKFSRGTGGGYPETWPAALENAGGPVSIDSLGTMQVEGDWSMTLIPAPGLSGSTDGAGLIHFANNPNWFDNTSDGPVQATVILSDGTRVPADPAWVLVAPPDFAPAVTNVVTLYDVLHDVAVRHFGIRPDIFQGPSPTDIDDFTSSAPPFNPNFEPSYRDEVYPILSRPGKYAWVQQLVQDRHKWDFDALSRKPFVPQPGQKSPAQVFARLRRPEDWEDSDETVMPVIWGDEDAPSWLTLTPTQYHILRQWSLGRFNRDGWAWPVPPPPAPAKLSAAGLDRAALEACAGGAFYPGIELGWIAREWQVLILPRLSGAKQRGPLRIVTAASYRLDRCVGPGWLAVGDAAMAWDPLSGKGIHIALESGRRAAETLSNLLENDQYALVGYLRSIDEEWLNYLNVRATSYNAEPRWAESQFWRRRRYAPANTELTEACGIILGA